MLHDGNVYRYYAFKQGSNTTFYQFGFNPTARVYQYSYLTIATLRVENMPSDSDTSNFAMLHDRTDYHFYFLVL